MKKKSITGTSKTSKKRLEALSKAREANLEKINLEKQPINFFKEIIKEGEGTKSKTPIPTDHISNFIANEIAAGASPDKIPSTISNIINNFFPFKNQKNFKKNLKEEWDQITSSDPNQYIHQAKVISNSKKIQIN